MDDTFDPSLAFALAEEGGFVDHPRDPRFAANRGISLARLRRFLREPGLDRDALRDLPCATVRALYMADFWNRCRCDALPPGIDLMVFDHAVDAGCDRAGRALQLAVGQNRTAIDGAIGPATLHQAATADRKTLLDALTAMQRTGYRQMAAFALFGDTWLARLDRRRAAAGAIAADREKVSRR